MPVLYCVYIKRKKGGTPMLNMEWIAPGDVDDLIFMDSQWNSSER